MQLINVTSAVINGYEQPAVNARELWEKLESKQQFADWIKKRLADFEEGIDFTVHKIMNGENKGRFASNEYILTLDTAKHLAMLERNENGKKIRQYFIEIERGFYQAMEEQQKSCSPRRPANIAVSTADLIEKINLQLLAGMEVEPEVLRYAWNIGRLVGKTMQKQNYPADLEEFIMGLASGEYTRSEVYDMYCQQCDCPMSARRFWPVALTIRPCCKKRTSQARKVIFQ